MSSICTVSGLEICSYLPWSSTDDQNCTEGRINRNTLTFVSLLPLGISNFYSGNHFNGLIELVEGFITVASFLVWWYCTRRCVQLFANILLALALLSVFVVEVIHMICSKQVEPFYIIAMVISPILPFTLRCCCYCSNNNITMVIVTISTMLVLSLGDALMVNFIKKVDGYGCPLID